MLPDKDGSALMRTTTDRTRAGAATPDESGASQQASTGPLASKQVDPAMAASWFAAAHWCGVGLHADCAQNATPWTIRLVRTIPRSIQQLCGLDKRLARAEIVAIQRELRASRANNSETAYVVQVPFAFCGSSPAP